MTPPGNPLFDLAADSALEPHVRAFRAALLLAQRLRYLMDDRLRADGLTTQQAALLTVVGALDRPSLGEAAAAMGTTHQNAAQLVDALVRKDLLRVDRDSADGRVRRLSATNTNADYWRGRNDADHAAVAAWFASLDPGELELLATLMVRVLDGLPASAKPVR